MPITSPIQTPTRPIKRLGKKAPRKDSRTLKLAKYIQPKLGLAPSRCGYIDRVINWPMFLNDSLGDCVCAAMAHIEQQADAYTGRPYTITDGDVLRAYEKIGGYNPNDPSTDQGCDMLTALKYWRTCGIGHKKIKAFVSVDYKNHEEVAQAIWLFGSVFTGLALPITAQNQKRCWSVVSMEGNGSFGSWGGHCVPLVGYNLQKPAGAMCVTWGETVAVTWNFVDAYMDECYAVITDDWIGPKGLSPSNFNLKQLLEDLTEIGK